MRNLKALVSLSQGERFQAAEMRRRIADCRERLRRERAARRIAERASPPVEELSAEGPETAPAAQGFGARCEES